MFTIGQQVTVIDGGWTGSITDIDFDIAYIKFPDCPERRPYAFEAIRPAMFDTLTPAERQALSLKLHDWAHRLFEVGHVLAQVSLVDDPGDILWNRRQQYVDARDEICALNAELAA